jgi:putative ABC transport system permease protein
MKEKQHIRPKFAQRFLTWFLRDDLAEEVQGDLEEQFYASLKNSSISRAKIKYWYQVLNYLRPFAVTKASQTFLPNYAMFRNYFKISIRNLFKQKLYAAINIGGLAVGLTCFILIFLFVQHELSYDRCYENADRIYRINYQYQPDELHYYPGMEYSASTPANMGSTLIQEFPEVVAATAIDKQTALIGFDEEDHYLEEGFLVDPHFLEVFNYDFIAGNPTTALDEPKSIVLTESLASRIFGEMIPLGQTVIYQNGDFFGVQAVEQSEDPYTVTGVIKDPPVNTSFQFTFIASILSDRDYIEAVNEPSKGWSSVYTFIILSNESNLSQFEEKLDGVVDKNIEEHEKYTLQPLTAIYLQSNVKDSLGIHGNPKYIYLFSAIAVIVLLLACANYMNLAIARSVNRGREVGLRKVVGARRQQLIFQFLGESVLITFLALLLALGLTVLVLPTFGSVIERPLEISFLENSLLLPGLFILVLIVGIISGSYPALYMSSLRPFLVLKGKIENRAKGFKLQKSLIVMQYVVSIILVIGSIVIYRQLQFIQNKELGYEKDHIITIASRDNNVNDKFDVIREELLQNSQVIAVTKSGQLPTNIRGWSPLKDPENDTTESKTLLYRSLVYYDFLQVFGIQLIAGRDFSREIRSDMSNVCMINETAAKALGWTPEEAIGEEIGAFPVIGIVKDFHMHSMHEPIQPLILILEYRRGTNISLKVRPEQISETIVFIEKTFKKYSPYPLEYSFLDDRFDELYKSEMKLGGIFGFFTVLSILIASLGIFGMAAFSTGQRTKEIGIRKVLGATFRSIMLLLSKDYLMLVVMAFFIVLPFAWYIIDQWLQDFAYKINIEWWIFALAGILTLLIAYLAIGYQSIKAAFINPVDSLTSVRSIGLE